MATMKKWGRRARILNLLLEVAIIASGAVLGVPALLTLVWLVFLLFTAIFTFGRLEVAHRRATATGSASATARVIKTESVNEGSTPDEE